MLHLLSITFLRSTKRETNRSFAEAWWNNALPEALPKQQHDAHRSERIARSNHTSNIFQILTNAQAGWRVTQSDDAVIPQQRSKCSGWGDRNNAPPPNSRRPHEMIEPSDLTANKAPSVKHRHMASHSKWRSTQKAHERKQFVVVFCRLRSHDYVHITTVFHWWCSVLPASNVFATTAKLTQQLLNMLWFALMML